MKTNLIPIRTLLLGVVVATLVGCESERDSRMARESAIGAGTGAVIGGVIGHNSGHDTGTGAAIGAVVGGAVGAAHADAHDRRRDDRLTEDEYYRSLLTDREVDILRARARASNRSHYELTDFLTSEEKENLRRRDAERRGEEEIGR